MSGSGWQRELTRNRKVEVALNNEALTRERVENLERTVRHNALRTGELFAGQLVLRRGFWGRLSWLLRGR